MPELLTFSSSTGFQVSAPPLTAEGHFDQERKSHISMEEHLLEFWPISLAWNVRPQPERR